MEIPGSGLCYSAMELTTVHMCSGDVISQGKAALLMYALAYCLENACEISPPLIPRIDPLDVLMNLEYMHGFAAQYRSSGRN